MDFMNCRNPVPGGFVDRLQHRQSTAVYNRERRRSNSVDTHWEKEDVARAKRMAAVSTQSGFLRLQIAIQEGKAKSVLDKMMPGWVVPPPTYEIELVCRRREGKELVYDHSEWQESEIPLCGECGWTCDDDGCEHDLTQLISSN